MGAEVAGRGELGEDEEEGENREENRPHDTGSEEAAERVSRPEGRDGEIERKDGEEEETAIGEAGKVGLVC